jgi:hypothetical protein
MSPPSRGAERGHMKVNLTVTEEDGTVREKLLDILRWANLACATITLRNGKTIEIVHDPERNPHNSPVRVSVGKNYIEIDIAVGASVPIYGMVPISQIASVEYF